MSISSTDEAAQVERAREIKEAKKRVAALQADVKALQEETKALQAKKVGLQRQMIKTKTDLRTELEKTKSVEDVYNAVKYGLAFDDEGRVATAVRATLAELEETLKLVEERLIVVDKDLLAALESKVRALVATKEVQKKAQDAQVCRLWTHVWGGECVPLVARQTQYNRIALLRAAMLPRDSICVNERTKLEELAAFGNECFACGHKEPEVEDRNWLKNYYKVANAQLVAASAIYDRPQLGFDKSAHTYTRNFLRLCGTKTDDVKPGDEGYRGRPSCHRMFANHMMSFVPAENADPDDCCSWRVFGGADLHDKQVQLPTLPHKIVMYAHLKTCADKRSILFCDTLESKATPIAAVTSWLDQVTPPRGSEQSKSSSPTDQ